MGINAGQSLFALSPLWRARTSGIRSPPLKRWAILGCPLLDKEIRTGLSVRLKNCVRSAMLPVNRAVRESEAYLFLLPIPAGILTMPPLAPCAILKLIRT
jgi:hypothetical protein